MSIFICPKVRGEINMNICQFLQVICVILENFCYCLIQKTLGELPDFEVMTWQLCNLLRSTLNCLQGTLILLQRYEFYLYIKSTVLFIMSLR